MVVAPPAMRSPVFDPPCFPLGFTPTPTRIIVVPTTVITPPVARTTIAVVRAWDLPLDGGAAPAWLAPLAPELEPFPVPPESPAPSLFLGGGFSPGCFFLGGGGGKSGVPGGDPFPGGGGRSTAPFFGGGGGKGTSAKATVGNDVATTDDATRMERVFRAFAAIVPSGGQGKPSVR